MNFPADVHHHGSIFTLFLHSPLTALCYICNVGDVSIHHWERCQSYVDRFVTEASRLVTRCRMDEIEQGIGYIGMYMLCLFLERNSWIFPLRFILRSILRWRFPSNIDPSIRFLWCCAAIASKFSRTSYEATMWASTASSRTVRTPIISSHSITISYATRRSRSLLWSNGTCWLKYGSTLKIRFASITWETYMQRMDKDNTRHTRHYTLSQQCFLSITFYLSLTHYLSLSLCL